MTVKVEDNLDASRGQWTMVVTGKCGKKFDCMKLDWNGKKQVEFPCMLTSLAPGFFACLFEQPCAWDLVF
jgi:hypothetical protein